MSEESLVAQTARKMTLTVALRATAAVLAGITLVAGWVYTLYVIVQAHPNEMSHVEVRFYILTALALYGIMVFGVLRIYNAVVTNTGRIVRLGTQLGVFMKSLGDHTREIKQTEASVARSASMLKSVSDKLADAASILAEAIRNGKG